ncbi:MAG TPA: hypothetical protein DCZ95_07795 [Verrucomicrobia bacterium]|nr:MAG: hypothetical protein A2X46_01020 [Lentisphaerae bacterium GWF2_57_35]HBA83978.1 hypothetical protein [Verrucomicrobiota bacterium]
MPIFEYQCDKCRKAASFLVRSLSSHKPPVCPKCGHEKMTKLLSKFAAVSGSKAESTGGDSGMGSGLESMPDMSMLEGIDENDPRSMGRVMRRMAEETGEQMPPEMDEMCRRLESGEDPEKIEQDMGDLMGEEPPGGGMGPGGGSDTLYEG